MMQMLPQELSQALVGSGGLGLAPQLYQALGGTMTGAVDETARKARRAQTRGSSQA